MATPRQSSTYCVARDEPGIFNKKKKNKTRQRKNNFKAKISELQRSGWRRRNTDEKKKILEIVNSENKIPTLAI